MTLQWAGSHRDPQHSPRARPRSGLVLKCVLPSSQHINEKETKTPGLSMSFGAGHEDEP